MTETNPTQIELAPADVVPHLESRIGADAVQLAAKDAIIAKLTAHAQNMAEELRQRDEVIASQAKRIEKLDTAAEKPKPRSRARAASTDAGKP